MKTIHKQVVPIADSFTLLLPVDAEVLTLQMQHGSPTVWYAFNPEGTAATHRQFRFFGTGHTVHDEGKMRYIGTVQMMEGQLVWHLFEVLS